MKGNNLLIEKEGKKYKVTSVSGKVCFFDSVDNFVDGFAKAIKEDKTYYINKFGDVFDNVEEFNDKFVKVCKYGLYGLCDKETTKIVLKPKYSWIWPFYEDLARVLKNGKFGFINTSCKEIIKPKYEYAWDFSCGYARIRKIWGRYNYINKSDERISEKGFFNAWNFRNNVAVIQNIEDDSLTRINTIGEEVN